MRLHLTVVIVLTGVLTAAGPVSARGQRAGGGPNRLIIRALANGVPVTDLKAEELSVTTDGKQRQVKNLELVTAPTGPAAPSGGAPSAGASPFPKTTMAPPFATTEAGAAAAPAPDGGREFLILLDEESIAPGREDAVRKAVAHLMSQASPADRFGLVSLRVGGASVAPTADRTRVTEVLAKWVGGGSTSETSADRVCRAKRSIDTLSGVLRGSPAGRALILVSPGIAAIQSGTQRMSDVREEQVAEMCQIRANDFDTLSNAAAASPAAFYVLHYADGASTSADASVAQQGLQNIAGSTRAEFMRLVGGSENAVQRIVRETASYYVVTLDEGPGPIRRVDARVARDGVKVQARPAGGGGSAAASAKGMSPRDMVKTTAVFSEVPLRAAGFVSKQGPAELKVITLFEPVDANAKLTAASVGLIDEKGGAKVWSARPEELGRYPVRADLTLPPGRYRVRVAATTATGGGTVDYEVTGELQDAPPLKMGSMLLGVTTEKGFAPKLQFTGNDAMAVGLVEVYGVPKAANVTVEFEIVEATGESRGAAPGTVRNAPMEDARMVIGGFDIATLEPGDYTMRAKISVDGKPAGTASRTLRKVQ